MKPGHEGGAYLIFVTDPKDISVEKNCHVEKFLHICHECYLDFATSVICLTLHKIDSLYCVQIHTFCNFHCFIVKSALSRFTHFCADKNKIKIKKKYQV